MNFVVRINLDNDAFCGGNRKRELARLLDVVKEKVGGLGKIEHLSGKLQDINGNTVGQFDVIED